MLAGIHGIHGTGNYIKFILNKLFVVNIRLFIPPLIYFECKDLQYLRASKCKGPTKSTPRRRAC